MRVYEMIGVSRVSLTVPEYTPIGIFEPSDIYAERTGTEKDRGVGRTEESSSQPCRTRDAPEMRRTR